MIVLQNQSLKKYHTFGTDAICKGLIEIYSVQDIYEFLVMEQSKFLVLGGGSNVLFLKDFDGHVLRNQIKGIEIIDEDQSQVLVKVGAGEIWHQFVMWTVAHSLWGIENLALIPGSVGAAPMQNIGAYGVEQNVCFHSLNAIEVASGTSQVFFKEDCKFGYRESIFKNEQKNKYIITHVSYMLSKIPNPILNYADVSARVGDDHRYDIQKISETIIAIRQEKLPDPKIIGNAGSFFKNPVIERATFDHLQAQYPHISCYPSGDKVKIAAAWLIDQCGFKGKTVGNTGSYKNQALVIVNHGNANGSEIFEYAQSIQKAVNEKFGIDLEMEVNLIS
jgi:UDP-N-acetylmuramate dehydrogenase